MGTNDCSLFPVQQSCYTLTFCYFKLLFLDCCAVGNSNLCLRDINPTYFHLKDILQGLINMGSKVKYISQTNCFTETFDELLIVDIEN